MASHITWMPEKTIFSRSPKREQKMKLDWITRLDADIEKNARDDITFSGSRIGYEDVTKPMGLPAYAVIRRHGEELDARIGLSIQDLLASDKARRVEATIKEQDDSTQNMDSYMKREESASRQGEGSKQRYYDDTKDMDAAERTRRDGASRSRRVIQPISRTAHESRRAPTWVDQRSQRQQYRQRTFSGPQLRVVHPLPPRPKSSPTQPSPATFPSNDASSSSNSSREKRRARYSPLNSPIYSPIHSPIGSPIGSPLGSPIGSPIMSPMEPHDEDAAWSAKPSEVKISLVPAGLSKTQRKKQRKLARMQPLDM
ncbi:hypothetical protein BGZ98_009863 [Dissophora globulifera]|nr:hypothetical protein BGZ98_009863 [Dissophora globulifera]